MKVKSKRTGRIFMAGIIKADGIKITEVESGIGRMVTQAIFDANYVRLGSEDPEIKQTDEWYEVVISNDIAKDVIREISQGRKSRGEVGKLEKELIIENKITVADIIKNSKSTKGRVKKVIKELGIPRAGNRWEWPEGHEDVDKIMKALK